MSTHGRSTARIIGTLREADGAGVVRLEDRIPTDVEDLWSALTEPDRLARWLGTFEGEMRPGGELHAHYFASGWEGTCRIEACEPPRRIRLSTSSEGEPDGVVELTLTPDGQDTVLVIEDRGLPLDHLADYGAGDQIHVEDLAAYLAGEGPCDARARWSELRPGYEELAADVSP
jgi:uncharacterized protein YndB with AHSA1/START domain